MVPVETPSRWPSPSRAVVERRGCASQAATKRTPPRPGPPSSRASSPRRRSAPPAYGCRSRSLPRRGSSRGWRSSGSLLQRCSDERSSERRLLSGWDDHRVGEGRGENCLEHDRALFPSLSIWRRPVGRISSARPLNSRRDRLNARVRRQDVAHRLRVLSRAAQKLRHRREWRRCRSHEGGGGTQKRLLERLLHTGGGDLTNTTGDPMLKTRIRSILAALAFSAFAVGATTSHADEMKIPQTTADHEALAKQYKDEATQYRKVAADHQAMAAAYAKSHPDS